MAKTLSNALGTDMNEIAALLRSKGRKGDTVLAHINPEEAALLKARGGAGTINPSTGLPEFYTGEESFTYDDYPSQTMIDTGTAYSPETSSLPEYQAIYEAPSYGYEAAFGGMAPGETFFTYDDYPSQAMIGQGAALPTQTYSALTPELRDIAYVPQPELQTPAAAPPPGASSAPKPEKGMLESFEETVRKYPATSNALANLTKFGLGGLATIPLMRQQQRAAQNTQQMADEIAALGQPIRQQGLQALSQAQAGQLTPAQRQNVAASRARTQQELSRQGITSGVAQQQAEANINRLTEQYVANNINNALQMVNVGNRYAQAAITQGYNANQQANQAANLFYQNLFAMMGGYAPRMG